MRKTLALLALLPALASAGTFVTDPASTLPGPKSDLRAVPAGADPNKYQSAADFNALRSASLDLRAWAYAPWIPQSTPFCMDGATCSATLRYDGTSLVASKPISGDVGTSTVTATGSTTARALRDRFSDVVNVRDFGAKGDTAWSGTAWTGTDDTAAIQAAVNLPPCSTYTAYNKPYRCGGEVVLPCGAYKVTSTIALRHGTRIRGMSRECTQIIASHPGAVLRYEDAGVYVPDEIVVENLSIWQDVAVAATSGGGIEVNGGTASPQSVSLRVANVNIEGTYNGILMSAGLVSSAEYVNVSRTVSHGVYVKWDVGTPKYATQTTSTSFRNVYSYFGGGSGFRFEGAAYVSCDGCASDSNAAYGYYLDTTEGVRIHGGAEQNVLGGAYLTSAQGTVLSLNVVQSSASAATQHGVTLNNANDTTLLGGFYSASASSTGYVANVLAGSPPTLIGPTFSGYYATHLSNTTINNDIRADGSGSFRFANIYATNWSQAGTFYIVNTVGLGTCAAGTEGIFTRSFQWGLTGTGARTRICLCTSDGAASPAYAWQNMVTGTVGNATTCSP